MVNTKTSWGAITKVLQLDVWGLILKGSEKLLYLNLYSEISKSARLCSILQIEKFFKYEWTKYKFKVPSLYKSI